MGIPKVVGGGGPSPAPAAGGTPAPAPKVPASFSAAVQKAPSAPPVAVKSPPKTANV